MSKQKKNKKTVPYRSSGIVKYGSDKYAVMLILLYPLIIPLVNKETFNIAVAVYAVCGFIYIPWLVFTVFCFRFCVKYDIKTREIQYRNFFKFRTIKFIDIKKVYRKSDGRTTFLIIQTYKRKIRINMRSCNGAREFSFFLKRHLPKVFED